MTDTMSDLLRRAAAELTITADKCTYVVCNPMGAPRRKPYDPHAAHCPRQALVEELLGVANELEEEPA